MDSRGERGRNTHTDVYTYVCVNTLTLNITGRVCKRLTSWLHLGREQGVWETEMRRGRPYCGPFPPVGLNRVTVLPVSVTMEGAAPASGLGSAPAELPASPSLGLGKWVVLTVSRTGPRAQGVQGSLEMRVAPCRAQRPRGSSWWDLQAPQLERL